MKFYLMKKKEMNMIDLEQHYNNKILNTKA